MFRKLIMRFVTLALFEEEKKYKRVTIKGIRDDITDEELNDFVKDYCRMTDNDLLEVIIVDERSVGISGDFIEIEEIFEDDPPGQEEGVLVEAEEVVLPEKRVETVSLEEREVSVLEKEVEDESSEANEVMAPKSDEEVTVSEVSEAVVSDPEVEVITLKSSKIVATEPKEEDVITKASEVNAFDSEEGATLSEASEVISFDSKEEVTALEEREIAMPESVVKVASGEESEVMTVEKGVEIPQDEGGERLGVEPVLLENEMIKLLEKYGFTVEIEEEFDAPEKMGMDLNHIGLEVLEESSFSKKPFIMPIKKRKMKPPVGRKMKSRKKKK